MRIIEQDITTVEGPCIVAHGVNCKNVMNSGVAKAIATKWPLVKINYLRLFPQFLTQTQWTQVSKGIIVVNCFTQEGYGKDGKQYATLHAIRQCLDTIIKEVKADEETKNLPLYIPKIGCSDEGGLKWEDVKKVILSLEQSREFEFTVCVWPGEEA